MWIQRITKRKKKKKVGAPQSNGKSFDLISSLQDIGGLKNRHKAWDKWGRIRGPEGLEVFVRKRGQESGRQELKGKEGSSGQQVGFRIWTG